MAANAFLKRIREDFEFRTYITSTLSFFVSLAFAGYNIYLGAAYKTIWNIGIAVYYLLLAGIRAFVGYKEIWFRRAGLSDGEKEERRKNVFIVQSAMLFAIDAALTVPITVMVMQDKEVNYSEIPAITAAAYAVYKIIVSSVSFAKTRKISNLNITALKSVNFIDALVSLLTLQYTLIMTFGEGVTGNMFTLCAVTSFVILALIITVSVANLIKSIKIKKTG